eukprot:11181643-Lingulodinium_polyedra.AAC.1
MRVPAVATLPEVAKRRPDRHLYGIAQDEYCTTAVFAEVQQTEAPNAVLAKTRKRLQQQTARSRVTTFPYASHDTSTAACPPPPTPTPPSHGTPVPASRQHARE